MQPFDNQVVRMELTGDQIYRLLEQQFEVDRVLQVSGLEYSYDASKPAGQRITSATVNGSPLDRGATYTVAANSYLATGGDGFTVFKEGQNNSPLATTRTPWKSTSAASSNPSVLPRISGAA